MSSENKPTIAVVSSSSKQGRSVAHALLKSSRYHVRALTGRTDAPEAILLAEQGEELVHIPLGAARKEDLLAAFTGADGAFLMTPGEVPPGRSEFEIGRDMADAAVEAGLRHVVFSSLENVEINSHRF